MPTIVNQQLRKFQSLCIKLVSELTNRPIGMYYHDPQVDKNNQGRFIIPDDSWDRFEAFCQYMHRDNDRKRKCMIDHQERAEKVEISQTNLCWAGLNNCCLAREVGQNRKVVLLGGEFRLESQQELSNIQFEKFSEDYQLSEDDKLELRKRFEEVPIWRDPDVLVFQQRLNQILNWYESYERMHDQFEQSVQSVAHDFSIHVSALNIECDLLREDISSAHISRDVKVRVQELQYKIQRLNDIVLNHLSSYQANPRFEFRTIGPLIYDAVRTYESQAQNKLVAIHVTLQKENTRTHEIEMSPSHLRRMFHNLIQNAVKYSYSGYENSLGIKERYINIEGEKQGIHYKVTIENYGIGIEEDEYDLVFKNGYQGRLTKAEFRSGSGTGLHFVKKVIDLHHGEIKVQSIPFESAYLTRFILYLPLTQPNGEEPLNE